MMIPNYQMILIGIQDLGKEIIMFKKEKWGNRWAVYLISKVDENDKHLIFAYPENFEQAADDLVDSCNRILEGRRRQ
jgi:hypothetical protein